MLLVALRLFFVNRLFVVCPLLWLLFEVLSFTANLVFSFVARCLLLFVVGGVCRSFLVVCCSSVVCGVLLVVCSLFVFLLFVACRLACWCLLIVDCHVIDCCWVFIVGCCSWCVFCCSL